jgi:hypothetical protein
MAMKNPPRRFQGNRSDSRLAKEDKEKTLRQCMVLVWVTFGQFVKKCTREILLFRVIDGFDRPVIE